MSNIAFGPVYVPPLPTVNQNSTVAMQNMLLDAAGEMAAALFFVPKDGEIAKLAFTVRVVTTGDTFDVRLETVSLTTGDPTGTLVDTNSNGSQVVADDDDDTTFLVTLTGAATVTADQLLAIVLVPAGTPNLNVANVRWYHVDGVPYTDLNTSSSWTKDPDAGVGLIEYDDGTRPVAVGLQPLRTVGAVSMSNASTPDEYGFKFKFPNRVTVSGAWFDMDLDGDADVVLYDSDGTTVLASVSLDANQRVDAARRRFLVQLGANIECAANTFYRLVLKPTSATAISRGICTVQDATYWDAASGGQDVHATERTNAGAWTDTLTERPIGGIYITGLGGPGGRLAGARLAG